MPDLKFVPQLASDFMNQEHEALALIHQQLQNQLNAESIETDRLNNTLQSLLQNCQAHFEHEEAEMQACDFPHYDVHKTEHQLILEVTQETIEAWQTQQDIALLKQYFELTFPTWFFGHIESMDAATALYITATDESERQNIEWDPTK